MTDDAFFQIALPGLDIFRGPGFWLPVAVVGPDLDAVRELMTTFDRVIDTSQALDRDSLDHTTAVVVPAHEHGAINSLLDDMASFFGLRNGGFDGPYADVQCLLAWPPSRTLDWSPLRSLWPSTHDVLTGLPPSLALAPALKQFGCVANAAVLESSLTDPAVINILQRIGWPRRIPGIVQIKASRDEVLARLQSIFRDKSTPGDAHEPQVLRAAPGFRVWPQTVDGKYDAPLSDESDWLEMGRCMSLCQANGERVALLHLSYRGGSTDGHPTGPVFQSTLPPPEADVDVVEWTRSQVISVRERSESRQPRVPELDRIVQLQQVQRKGLWSATSHDEDLFYRIDLTHLGFPVVPLNSIVKSWQSTVGAHARPPVATGQGVREIPGLVLRTVDDEWVSMVFRLWKYLDRDAMEAEAYGTLRDPYFSEGMVKGWMVPWPDERTRKELLARVRQCQQAVESARLEAEELAEGWLQDDGLALMAAVDPRATRGVVAASLPSLAALLGLDDLPSRGPTADLAAEPFFPIALLERRLGLATVSAEKLQATLSLGEAIIRLALACTMSATAPDIGGIVLREAFNARAGHRIRLSLGHWIGAIRELCKASGMPPPGVRKGKEWNNLKNAMDAFVELRNAVAHGVYGSPVDIRRLLTEAQGLVRQLREPLGDCLQAQFILPLTMAEQRERCSFTYKVLNGSHPEFAPSMIELRSSDPRRSLHMAEIAWQHDKSWRSLWPWYLIVEEEDDGDEWIACWDGLEEDGRAIFLRVDRPRHKVHREPEGRELLRLFFSEPANE